MKFSRSALLPILVLIAGSLIFFYTGLKAQLASFTHDESFSYLHYCHESFIEIITFNNWYTNNHVLNSLFMKYSAQLFGTSEFALRLPNLLLLLVYMAYSFYLFRDKNPLLALAIFLLLCTNTLLIDLFGLARGYGMSCGFMLMSLYHFLKFGEQRQRKDLFIFHLAALLAILSNFTLLAYYTAALLTYNLSALLPTGLNKASKFNLLSVNKVHALPLMAVFVILYEPVRRLLTKTTLDFGGSNGFYEDTVSHLVYISFHHHKLPQGIELLFEGIFTLSIVGALAIIIWQYRCSKQHFFVKHSRLLALNLLLLSLVFIIVAQHYFLGSDYPIGRFSIFLFPLFIIHLGYLLSYLLSSGYQKISLAGIMAVALFSSFEFSRQLDFHSTAEWDYDKNSKNMMTTLARERQRPEADSGAIRLGVSWLFEPTANFYRRTREYNWLLPVQRQCNFEEDDYCYVFKNELPPAGSVSYDIVEEYHDTQSMLIRINPAGAEQ